MRRIRDITIISAATGTLVLGLSGVTYAARAGSHASHKTAGSHASRQTAKAPHASRPTAKPGQAAAAPKVVSYRGYQVRVPGSWRVYRLDSDPSQCVLFDRHAVYLGTPGANQRCPARAVGRTEAILVQPLNSLRGLPAHTSVQRGNSAEMPSRWLAAKDAVSQMLRLALPRAGVEVTASYGSDLSLIRKILRNARVTASKYGWRAGPARHSHAASAHGPARHHARPARSRSARHSPARHSPARHSPARHGKSRHTQSRHTQSRHTQAPTAAPPASSSALEGVTGNGLGFDTCTVPSTATMHAWLASPFRMVGTYLGGDNWACSYGNFSRSWISQVAGEGWRFIPLWVGPQAPCTFASGVVRIDPSQAGAEGVSQARSAVSTAASFGYGRGSPIYFDMEGYDNLDRSCSSTVLTFLSAWSWELHRSGYTPGVYSSAGSGAGDLAGQYGRSTITEPSNLWFAEWNHVPVVSTSYLPSGDWRGYRRVHQFDGPNVETFGGVSVDIDDDYVAGSVAGTSTPPGPYLLSQPDAMAMPNNGSRQVRLVVTDPSGPGSSQRVDWQVRETSGVTVTPDQGMGTVMPGGQVSFTVRVSVSSTTRWGRYNLPVTVSSGGQSLSGTSLLVSVTSRTLATPRPVLLYAADGTSMAEAVQLEHDYALPSSSVTGSLYTAWQDVAAGKDIVIAVGQRALNGLYTNPCGWFNPDHRRAGSTPFTHLGGPLDYPPGKNYFEDGAASSPAVVAQLDDALLKYALSGALPSPHAIPDSPAAPTNTCIS